LNPIFLPTIETNFLVNYQKSTEAKTKHHLYQSNPQWTLFFNSIIRKRQNWLNFKV
jgi:hypothetical protein